MKCGMTLELTEHESGVVVRVLAVPGSRRNAILGIRNGALRVAVTQIAEKGKANKGLIGVLAKQLGLRKSQIRLDRGETSTQKQFVISSITEPEFRAIIARFFEPDPQ
jgi:uncharacterized protein (TIGR00251 family)